MDLKNSRVFQMFIRVFLLLNILVCPLVFIGMMFAPQMIGFLEPVVCPSGMEMETVTEEQEDSEGDMVLFATVNCVDGRDSVDVSWKVLGIMFGFPALGVLAFFFAPTSSSEKDEYKIDPEASKQ